MMAPTRVEALNVGEGDGDAGTMGLSVNDPYTQLCVEIHIERNASPSNANSIFALKSLSISDPHGVDTIRAQFGGFTSNGWDLDFDGVDPSPRVFWALAIE